MEFNAFKVNSKNIKFIADGIQKISENSSKIKSYQFQIGTTRDSDILRKNLHHLINSTNKLAKDVSKSLFEVATYNHFSSDAERRQFRMQKDKLTDDLTSTLNVFQEAQRSVAKSEKASISRAKANSGIGHESFLALTDDSEHTQSRSHIQMEEDVDVEELRMREQEIQVLEADIFSINQIFKDLGMLIHEQGEVLDSIEANVENSSLQVEQGYSQLQAARSYQIKARKKLCIICSVIAVVIVIIVLVIYAVSS